MYRFGSPPNYNPKQEDSIENLARIKGVSLQKWLMISFWKMMGITLFMHL